MTNLFSTPLPSQAAPQVIFVLRVSDGSFATGFSATLDILEPGRINPPQKYPMPAFTELPEAYTKWQKSYSDLSNSSGAPAGNTRTIQPIMGQIIQHSYAECQSACKQATVAFEDICLKWFAQPTFEALRRSIVSAVQLRQLQQTPILLDANTNSPEQNTLLQKLPWHIWALFEKDLRRSEMILNAPVAATNYQLTAPINVLAVFGAHSGGLQLNGDLAVLKTHLGNKGATLTLLDQPNPKDLQESLRKQPWDILFFAGHSNSCAQNSGGVIHLKEGVVLSLRDLKASLNQAVENGLKLAIFNSCDGLGLADYLAEREVPISIVMREPVPDRVARYFLEYFLEEFSQGQITLQAAVRVARERLQWLESDGLQACPAATWLPIICQNPNQSPLLWPAVSKRTGSMKKKQGKVWWKGALLLFVLMVVGKIISVVIGSEPIAETLTEPEPPPYEERFSEGDRELFPDESQYIDAGCPAENKKEFEQAKDSGIQAMQQRNYVAAEKSLNQAWSLCSAPETLIYLNNAKIGSAQALTLAITVPITQKNPKNPIEMLRGAAQAQSVINQSGGINGLPLKLIVIDDSDDPEVAKKIASTLISNDSYRDVLAVVGHWTSGVTLQAAKVYNAQKALVFMTPISIIGDLTGGSWVFRSTINMRDEQTALANYAYSSLNYKKVAVFYLDSKSVGPDRAAYSEGAKRLFRQFFQGDVIDIDFNLASKDFENKEIEEMEPIAKAMVKEAKKNGAEAILLVPDNSRVSNAEAVIKAAASEGIGLLGATNLYRQEVLQRNCPDMVGMTLSMAWQAKGRANPTFVKSSADFWRGEVNFATAMTYNATQAMAAAMREKPTREGVHEVLNREGFVVQDTADAQPLKFENGDRIAPAQIVRVQTTAGSDPNVPECEFVPIK